MGNGWFYPIIKDRDRAPTWFNSSLSGEWNLQWLRNKWGKKLFVKKSVLFPHDYIRRFIFHMFTNVIVMLLILKLSLFVVPICLWLARIFI